MAGDGDAPLKEKKEKKEKSSKDKEKGEKSEKVEKADKGEKKEKKEKKDKSSDAGGAADGADKPVKEKKEKKEKSDKADTKGEKSSSKDKDKGDGASSSKGSRKEKEEAAGRPGAPPPPPARAPPPKSLAPKKKEGVYLGGFDLPSSEESDDEGRRGRNSSEDEDDKPLVVHVSGRETKKLADKERKAAELAYRAKEDALREDDNVFDVSYEGQGDDVAMASATDVKVHNLTIRAKGKILLDSTSLTIAAGRRYGLVGPNGRGKSTLLRMMAKRQIPVPENIDVLLVEQEVVGTNEKALQAVVAADVELMALRAEEAQLQAQLEADGPHDPEETSAGTKSAELAASREAQPFSGASNGEPAPALSHEEAQARLNEVYERLEAIGGAGAESRASKILHGLGFTVAMQKRDTNSFSGGWRMRISLARALYIQPTLLLLDEPTNHLDLRAVLWLEEYLQRWKKTLIVVSHDRDFLNTITTDIIHLHDLKLHMYKGNFAQFEEMYEQKRREVNKVYDKFEKQLRAAKASGQNSKANQQKVKDNVLRTAAKKGGKGGGPEDSSSAAAATTPQKWSDYTVEFNFPEPTELPPPLIQLIDGDFKYPSRDDFGLKDVNLGIDMGSRIAIVGPNGAGKTTLMNLLSGDLVPTSGESRRSHKLRIGRYAQHFVDALSFDENPVEYLLRRFPESGNKPEGMRALLGRFGLGGAHHLTPICKLSGGQKARVVFSAIALLQPHILLLDEPTNHLDMQSIDALCDALEQFTGGVVVISHDAQLLQRLCMDEERSEVLIVDDGKITHYAGDFDDYRMELVKEISAEMDEP